MNSLHTSLPQKTPVRGVALRPQEETRGDHAHLARTISTAAIEQRRETLFARSMDALRKAARGNGVMPHVVAFILALFAVVNMAQAQATYYWVGGGSTDWGRSSNWSLASGGAGGAGVPGSNYGNAQDIAIFDGNSGTTITILTGFPTGAPGVGQIRLLNSFSSGPQVTFGGAGSTVATIAIGGVPANTNNPLFVGSLCKLFVDQNITMNLTGAGGASSSAAIFGDLSIRIGGTVNSNAGGSRFRIEDGGSLRMSGGTFTATAGNEVLYALTGNRGSLVYDRNDNTTVTIPTPNNATEVPMSGTAFLGNLVIRRPLGSVTTFAANGAAWEVGGTLIVDGCPLNLPQTTLFRMNLAASRMQNNGNIFGAVDITMTTNELIYRDLAAAAGVTPLNPTVSDLSFGINSAGLIPNGQYLSNLTNNIAGMNLSINSDLNIVASMAGASGITMGPGTVGGGQITIPASRTLTLRRGLGTVDALNNTGRLIVNGTFAMATGATFTNNNTNINSPLAGILVNAGGRIQLNGTATINMGTANGAFYNGPTATLEYLDRNASVTTGITFEAFTGTGAYPAPTGPRNATVQELPADMRGGVTVNRLYPEATGTPSVTSLVAMQQNTVMNGPLTLTQGTFGLNSLQLILNGTVTTNVGAGYLAGNNMAGTSALVYNSTANGTIAFTTATAMTYGNFLNYLEVNNTGNLSFANGQKVVIDGSTPLAAYGLAGVSNYNGQLRFNSTGNLILNSSDITFSGNMGAANTTGAAQGGHIPITTASVGAITGDNGSRLIFTSRQIRSFPRLSPGGQVLNEIRLTSDGTANANPAMSVLPTVLRDYMVSLRTPLQTSIMTLQNNGILQLANGANLTVLNPPDLATAINVPNDKGNFVDASQGGSLQLRGYLTPGNVLIPVGVSFVGMAGAVTPSSYRPITVSNSVTALPGENYTVTVTSAIVNLVPAIPTLANNSMRGQWNITAGSGVNGAGGVLRVGWGNTPFPNPMGTVIGDEPNLAGQFQPVLNGPNGTNLTTIRRWNGTTYSNVLPTGAVNSVGTNAQSIQATYNGALSSTIFIVTNDLFPIYWVGGSPTAGDWNVTNNWASSSAGVPGSANPPGVNDWAVFDKAQAPKIATNIPANIQQMSVIENANVTLAPTDIPRTLSINRDLTDNDNLLIGPGSRLALGTGTFPITITLPTGMAGGLAPNTSVFGTLAILANGTYNHVDATSRILIANGGTLHIGTASASSLPTVTTGFQKLAGTTLQYGRNQTSGTPPYTIGAPAEQNATLRYEDANGGIDVRSPGVTTGELPASPFPGNIVINKTTPGASFGIVGNYTITSTATLQAGIWDLTQAFMGGGGFGLTVGTDVNPASGAPGSRTLKITGSLPNTGLRGNVANSTLSLQGPGIADLQFVPGGEFLNTLTMNDASNAAPNAALSAVLKSNLTVGDPVAMTGAFTMTNARTAVGMDYGLTILSPNTLRLQRPSTITSGRILNQGTVAIPTMGALALPSDLYYGGLDIATTGTLNIINDGSVTGTFPSNPVRYLNVASRLLYSAEGAGFANKTTQDMAFPPIFNASLVIDKNFAAATTTNTVDLNGCKVVTQGTVQLVGGDLRLMGFLLKIGSAAQFSSTATLDFVNNTISSTARLLPGGGRIFGENNVPMTVTTSSLVYNSIQSANLWLGQEAAGTHTGRSLNKLEINGPATLTLSTGAVVHIESGGTPTCGGTPEATYQGTLRLDNSTGNLALNGSSLRFTGGIAPTGGQVLTTVTGGTISGDALSGTSIRIGSQRTFNLKMASGAGASLRSFSLDPGTVFPAGGGQRQISLLSSMTTDQVGVTRNILSLMSPSVNLTVTGIGANSTTGNTTVGEAAFGLPNTGVATSNNLIDLSPGGTLTMTIPNNSWRMFPIGATNHTQTFIRPAPLMIRNGGGASDTYTVGLQRGLTFQDATYPDKVNLQWTIAKGSPSAMNQMVNYGWHTEHESGAPGFLRQNSFAAQWNGSAYVQSASDLSSTMTPTASPRIGSEWGHTVTYTSVNMAAANPFAILTPPTAIILAADSLSTNGSGGFNPTNAFGFSSGNLTITSGQPFTLRLSAFNGLNQRSPVRVLTNVRANLMALPGGTATFNTTGTGSVLTPIVLDPTLPLPGNPVSATTTTLSFDWLNPGSQTSTQATLILYDPSGLASSLTSASLTITILPPPIRSSTIAYSQVQGSSTGTQGFNGGGLGQFNITGGVQFPVDFGFFSRDNLLIGTNAVTSVLMTVTPITPGAMFSTTATIPVNQLINPVYVNGNLTTALNGRISPIINWTNAGVGGGVVKAWATLTANPGTPYAFSTSVVINVGTGATVPVRLGYSVNSGDILDAVLGFSGVNNGNYTQTNTNPIVSGTGFPVYFASFADNGMVIRPATPTATVLSVAPNVANPSAVFTFDSDAVIRDTLNRNSTGNSVGVLRPKITWSNPGLNAGYAKADLTLTQISGTTLLSTTVTIDIFTTGNVAVAFAMSQSSSTGTQGISINNNPVRQGGALDPIRASSGTPFNVDYGFYNAWGLPASGYVANNSFTITVIPPFGEQVTLDGNPVTFLPFPITRGSLSNLTLNWRNPVGANPPPIDVQLQIDAQAFLGTNNPPLLRSITTVTIRLSSSANAPVFLGLSQVSSTSSVGVNNGSPNIVSGVPFNVDAGLFDINGALTRSLVNISTVLTVENVPGFPGSFTIGGNTGGVFVNQSGIRFNNVVINWNNPTPNTTTRVRLRISTTAGATVQSTFADLVISAGDIFPRIQNINPAVGGPGTSVQITGVNFTGVNSVTFNGVPAASFQVQGDGLIVAVAPPGVSTGPIVVSRPAAGAIPGGSGSSAPTNFTVGAAPVISSITPTAGGINAVVLVRGSNLFNVSNIRIADIAAEFLPDLTINNSTNGSFVYVRLTGPLVVPGSLDVSRSGPVTMATLNGTVVSSQFFTYNPGPVVTVVTPNTAIVNGQDIPIVITGRNFNFPLNPQSSADPLIQQSGLYFTINNSPMAISPALRTSVQSVTPTEIRATISGSFNNMAGQRFLYIQNADGQYIFVPFQLTPAQAPTITSINPSTTTATGVAFNAVITGSNFFGNAGTTVTAVGANGQSTNLVSRTISPTQLLVTIPDALNSVGQTLNITVRNSDNQFATTQLIIRDPGRPFITSITPPRAVVGSSGITISINGGNYFLNAIVTLNITELQVISRSTTNIVAFVPGSLLTTFGSPTLSVRNGLGGFAAFAFFPIGYAAPTVTQVVTASGPNPGQTVTSATVFPFNLAINGTGFRSGLTATFNGTPLTIVSTSPTQVVVAVPGGLNGTQGVFPVAITNDDGQRAEGLFTIGTPNGPRITSISPTQEVAIGSPFVLTVEGVNFSVTPQGQLLAGTQILFNGIPLAILQASPTRIVAQVPAGTNTREGTAQIEVVNSDLQRASFPMAILCSQCPIVRSYTPTTVRPTNTYGFDVTFTLNGSNFRPGAVVTIGGTPLVVRSVSDSVITAVAPPGFFFGNGEIIVTNLDGRRFVVPGRLITSVSNTASTPMTGRAFPNPVEDMLTFETDITKTSVLRVRLTDMLGRTVTSFEQQVAAGRFTHQLDVSGLAAGVYIFEMNDGSRRFTEKIIKR